MKKGVVITSLAVLGTVLAFKFLRKPKTKTVETTNKKLSPKEFFDKYYSVAKLDERNTGVPALVTLAQAALESGFGRNAPGNNFFGIKSTPTWKGETQLLKTWESGKTGDPKKDNIKDEIIAIYKPGDKDGIFKKSFSYRVRSKFRKYTDASESFLDHSRFLITNSRYKPAFEYKTDPYKFAYQVAKAGYATDPNYYPKLYALIEQFQKMI